MPSYNMVKCWTADLCWDRRRGDPEEALKLSHGRNVRLKQSAKKAVVLSKLLYSKNLKVSVQLIADAVGINTRETSGTNTAGHRSLCKTVPQMFYQKMKDYWCEGSCENLKLMQLEWNLVVRCLVTDNEPWIHHCDHETK